MFVSSVQKSSINLGISFIFESFGKRYFMSVYLHTLFSTYSIIKFKSEIKSMYTNVSTLVIMLTSLHSRNFFNIWLTKYEELLNTSYIKLPPACVLNNRGSMFSLKKVKCIAASRAWILPKFIPSPSASFKAIYFETHLLSFYMTKLHNFVSFPFKKKPSYRNIWHDILSLALLYKNRT